MRISEKQVLDAIASVLMENRKVLKVGSPSPSVPPASDMSMPPMNDPSMMGDPMGQAGMPGDQGMEDPSMGDPNAMGGEEGMDNQFDTNFDAGVEADEETVPKHYIQQLTGKLSQSINSFNSEQGPDAGLCKYVASMIVAATCKNLDEKAKKEIIEKINSAASDEGDEDMPADDGEMEEPMDSEMPMDDGQQQPMMESVFSKRQLKELFSGSQERQENLPDKKRTPKGIFGGKSF